MKKIIYITLILVMLLNIVMSVVIKNEVYGASTYTQYIKSGIDEFPDSYKEYLKKLSEQHPNWNFEAYYTGISWDELVDNEVKIGKNRVIASADSKWINSSGSEKQSQELVESLLSDFENEPQKIWESNIFGKSLHELVNEGLQAKLMKMPEDAQLKLQETLERIINEGSGGLICIIL